MATMLKQVLQQFEQADAPLTLPQMARNLGVEPGMLDGMIQYWVRKGRLREAGTPAADCSACGHQNGCPFVVEMPRSYELVTDSDAAPPCAAGDQPSCCCQ